MGKYSALSLLRGAFNGQSHWEPAWRHPEPKASYDVVIIGGGGHGLATAYYLAKNHGITNVAVLEKGWLGGGNTGRNTTIVRSNYFFPESAAIYDFALRLYEGLSQDLDYNIMLSQRGILMMGHSEHDKELMTRSVNAMLLNGIDVELLDAAQVRAEVPSHVAAFERRALLVDLCLGAHHDAGDAEPALQATAGRKRVGKGFAFVGVDPFEREHLLSRCFAQWGLAAHHGFAVDVHRAAPALPARRAAVFR